MRTDMLRSKDKNRLNVRQRMGGAKRRSPPQRRNVAPLWAERHGSAVPMVFMP